MSTRIAVVGGSGFVGRAVLTRLHQRGTAADPVRAPRLAGALQVTGSIADDAAVASLASDLAGFHVVINCAGNPDASSRDRDALFAANALLPGVIAAAARQAQAHRFIHVSSAVVQGSAHTLTASWETAGSSDYAQSKIAGELAVRDAPAPASNVIYRPPSVHSAERRVTRSIRRLARSPFASVVGTGEAPTPQAHIDNVADAIAELALTKENPPAVVIHPWEGWTTGDLMRAFGDKEPLHLPATLGSTIRGALHLAGRWNALAANARRVEMMWFGQGQEASWLTEVGWSPPAPRDAWAMMLHQIDMTNASPDGRAL